MINHSSEVQFKPYFQHKSVHQIQSHKDSSPRKPSKFQQQQSPKQNNQLSTSLSFTKSPQQKPQQNNNNDSYINLLIQQIKSLEEMIDKLKLENQILKSTQKIGFLELQYQNKQMNKLHSLFKSVQDIKLENIKLRKNVEQLNLMMKIHLQPINEMQLQLNQQNNLQKSSIIQDQNLSMTESPEKQVKIHANLNKYQKCKTETQLKESKI